MHDCINHKTCIDDALKEARLICEEKGLRFTEDYVLTASPSGINSFICGTSTSGPDKLDLGGWKFGNQDTIEKALEAGEEPDPDWFLSWLLNPNLAKYGAIPKVLDDN